MTQPAQVIPGTFKVMLSITTSSVLLDIFAARGLHRENEPIKEPWIGAGENEGTAYKND